MSVLLKILLIGALILALLAAFFGWRTYTHSTAYLLAKGDRAAEEGKHDEVERLAKLLEKKGDVQAARLLRGEDYVYLGIVASGVTPPPDPYEDLQRAGQMIAANAGVSDQALAGRGVLLLFASWHQESRRVSSPALSAFRRGLAELAQIQDDGPVGVRGTLLAAECLMHLEEKRLAEEGLKALLKCHPDNKDAHRFLSVIYIDLNSPMEAVIHLEEWARLDPANGLPYRWIGFFKRDNQQVGEAIDGYEQALKRQLPPPIRADAIKELAEIYHTEGQSEKALETLALGSESFQNDPEILALRVNCLRNIVHREQEAVELVERALQKNPDHPKILFLRAQMFENEDQPGKALPLLEKAAQIDPYDLPTLTLLMKVNGELGKNVQADQLKAQANEVQDILTRLSALKTQANSRLWDDSVRLEIALLALKINQPEQARTWAQAALACNPGNAKARRLLAQLPAKEKTSPSSDSTVLGKK